MIPHSDAIRDAGSEEIAALEALQWRASTAWEDYRAQLLAHPDAIRLEPEAVREGRVRVADVAGAPRGFSVVLATDAEGVCELDGLFVEPACWRDGIGRALVEDLCARAAAGGARAVEVTANPRAIGFYERLGFVRCGSAETRFGPADRMRREPLA